MTRVRGGGKRRKRHKKIIAATKGYRGTRGRLFKRSKEAYLRAGQHAYAGRRLRKRDMRRLWIQRINAALEEEGISYSKFVHLLKNSKIEINRKMLAQIALEDPKIFQTIVAKAKKKETEEKPANKKEKADLKR
jgi:large subunit ribosomal protein L20